MDFIVVSIGVILSASLITRVVIGGSRSDFILVTYFYNIIVHYILITFL